MSGSIICTTCLHRSACRVQPPTMPHCWESDGSDEGVRRLRGVTTPRDIREQAIADLLSAQGEGAAWAWETCLRCETEFDTSVVGLFADTKPPQGFRVEWDVRLVATPVGCRR